MLDEKTRLNESNKNKFNKTDAVSHASFILVPYPHPFVRCYFTI